MSLWNAYNTQLPLGFYGVVRKIRCITCGYAGILYLEEILHDLSFIVKDQYTGT